MKKNILAENMLRFGTKNLTPVTKRRILESMEPKQEDVVTYNGKKYAVLASAWDESSLEPNDPWIAQKIKEAGADETNWVLLQTGKYDNAYDDLSNEQLKYRWDAGIFEFVPADKLSKHMSADDVLDIIMSYTKDPDDAYAALSKYQTTGDFGDDMLAANIERDPRWNV